MDEKRRDGNNRRERMISVGDSATRGKEPAERRDEALGIKDRKKKMQLVMREKWKAQVKEL